jgi:23S rRNA (adenine2503-C2)-methyltransferase
MTKTLIHSLTQAELTEVCAQLDLPKYRAPQIWRWLYVQRAKDWASMKNLPSALRTELAERFLLDSAVPLKQQGELDDTCKILVGLHDEEQVEEVLISAPGRRTVCISTQVGCRFHCAFCASGQNGFHRNLEAGEMVGQVLLAANTFSENLTNVVFMGMGEPLDNYDATLKAVRIINDKDGLNIGARKITISTCGIIPGIERLAAEGLQVELSVSLHAPNDELRSQLMPVNRKYPIADLLKACKAYFAETKRIITFEYTLIQGINDSPRHAKELATLLSYLQSRVNLIPLSPVEEFAGQSSLREAAETFMNVLEQAGINATLRRSKGSSLKAACGQLRFQRNSNPAVPYGADRITG